MGIWFEIAVLIILVFDAWQKRQLISLQKNGNRSRDKPDEQKKTEIGIDGANRTDEIWRKRWRGEGDDE